MGSGSWTDDDFRTYSTTKLKGKTTREVYSNSKAKDDFDPINVKCRESRDSDEHPDSNAIILAFDVTGSMSNILDNMVRRLGDFLKDTMDRKPLNDPQILCAGIGDIIWDKSPLQITQFESDIRIAEQLTEIWLECGGGGNNWESYNLPWYFAAMKTSIDCFEKRNRKGVLFTIGDEDVPENLTSGQIKKIFGDNSQGITNEELLKVVKRSYDVYHLITQEGYNYRDNNLVNWRRLLGQNVIPVKDYKKIPEILTSILQVNAGVDKDEVIDSWDGSTSIVIKSALSDYKVTKRGEEGLVTFD